MKTIAFGEIIWDVYPDEAVIGGAPFNFAAHLAHLGDTAYLASAVAEDGLGKDALTHIRAHGVRADLMQVSTHPTGRCTVTLNADKIPQYDVATDVAYDNLTATDAYLHRIREIGADVFYFNTLIQRGPVSREALVRILQTCSFPDIFCDINLRKNCFDRDSLLRCLTSATMLKVSLEEAHFLPELGLLPAGLNEDALPEQLCRSYPNIRYAVFTLGADGSAVFDARAGKLYRSGKPEQVPVVSTVGAGDCYGATFLHSIMAGMTVPQAIRAATERSNIVVSHKEAIPF